MVKPAIEHELEPVLFASSLHNCFPKAHLDIIYHLFCLIIRICFPLFLWSVMYSFLVSPILVACLALCSLLDFTVSWSSEGMNRAADGSNRPPFPDSTNSV